MRTLAIRRESDALYFFQDFDGLEFEEASGVSFFDLHGIRFLDHRGAFEQFGSYWKSVRLINVSVGQRLRGEREEFAGVSSLELEERTGKLLKLYPVAITSSDGQLVIEEQPDGSFALSFTDWHTAFEYNRGVPQVVKLFSSFSELFDLMERSLIGGKSCMIDEQIEELYSKILQGRGQK